MNNQKEYVCVSGFSASGSSAVVDLLKEFDGFFECSAEIRIIQDPYGITQLERALIDDWNEISSSIAINDFLWLCKKCAKVGGGRNPFAPSGLSYSKKICKDFYNLSVKYIESLSSFSYKSDYYCQKFKKSYIKYVFDRILLGIQLKSKGKIRLFNVKKKSYFSHPSIDEFERETKKFFNNVFQQNFYAGYRRIILDQAISVNKPDSVFRYFDNGKLIIVDRDPRDMFIDDIVNWGNSFDSDLDSIDAGKRFVLRHKAMRSNYLDNPNILYINFEELVLNYEETVTKILKFLGADNEEHINKFKYFNPNVSKKNIGIWKKYYNEYKEAIDYIYLELKSYCVED